MWRLRTEGDAPRGRVVVRGFVAGSCFVGSWLFFLLGGGFCVRVLRVGCLIFFGVVWDDLLLERCGWECAVGCCCWKWCESVGTRTPAPVSRTVALLLLRLRCRGFIVGVLWLVVVWVGNFLQLLPTPRRLWLRPSYCCKVAVGSCGWGLLLAVAIWRVGFVDGVGRRHAPSPLGSPFSSLYSFTLRTSPAFVKRAWTAV